MDHSLLPSIHNASLPATYEAAKMAIMECNRVDECKDWGDKMAALASYARQSKDEEMEKMALRIRARAIRRCGELLKEVEKMQPKESGAMKGITDSGKTSERKQAATDAGLSPRQAATALQVANVPESSFNEKIESDKPPTITALAKAGTTPRIIPQHERQGMTIEQFQSGIHFRGAMETFIKESKRYTMENVVNGTLQKDRDKVRAMIAEIDAITDSLSARL
jgi:hypothetical protein